uniref:Cadherin domain-containing protein n=1 Tax=Amphilophus citrinellus TaxID=61819 RepID=A0A3Q0S3K6_AMPCI
MTTVKCLTYVSSGWRSFRGLRRLIGLLMLLLQEVNMVGAQIRYSIPEEMKKGSVIGDVAQDMGLDLKRLRAGRARIVTGENVHYTELKTDKGILVVNERIDREQLCGDITPCSFSFEMILENPLELHRITVEVLDINDHAPVFPNKDKPISFEISESSTVGVRFPLQSAQDLDVGQNALQDYILSTNDNFILKQHASPDGRKYVEMVLQKPLDRERDPHFSLKLIAVDGGTPQRSGTVNIYVTVIDANDNIPVFNQSVYKATVVENTKKVQQTHLALMKIVEQFTLVIISVKIYRWRQSRILYHSNLPVIPYYPPRYSDTLGTGTLPHVYNYEVCRTTDSRKSDCKFGIAGSQNVLIMDLSSTGTMQRMQSEKSILDEPDSPIEVGLDIPSTLFDNVIISVCNNVDSHFQHHGESLTLLHLRISLLLG